MLFVMENIVLQLQESKGQNVFILISNLMKLVT